MGCCFSAGDRNTEAEHRRSIDGEPPSSPPGILEVETVKEVLLETPVAPKDDEKIKAMPPGNQEWKAEVRPTATVINGNPNAPRKDDGDVVSEVSEISEMCSYSESLSTTAALEKSADIDDGVVDQRPPPRKRRAHGGGRGRGERVVARRTAAPSPEKRGQVAPLRSARGRPVAEENGNGKRKDLLEGSRRRSRSPEKREEAAAAEPRNDVVPVDEAESLENPVVSLECFIFL